MSHIVFAYPGYFFLFIIIPLLIVWYIFKNKLQNAALQISTIEGFERTRPSLRVRMRHLPFILRLLALSLIIVALARPQSSVSFKKLTTKGIDIVITLDVSTSMLAEDFKPNRLEAAKKTAMQFIDDRVDDRLGLVVFAAESFTQCPVTIDHDVLKNLFKSVKSGLIEDGTAIGMGLATAINRLKDSKAKSKVIILLTDGINNTGFIAPETAADIAKSFGIKVYTIGVGSIGYAPYPFQTPFGTQYQNIEVKIDEPLLRSIAKLTGGKYFRAKKNTELEQIYKEIDKMEKTVIKDVPSYKRYSEKFFYFVLAAGILFIIELLLKYVIFRSIP